MYRIGQEEINAAKTVIETKDFFKINGSLQSCYKLEEALKNRFSVNHASFVTSGFGALVSALIGFGIGPGDEVIVPAYTYIATAMAVVNVGAIPVIAEIDETLGLDPDDFEKKISKYTKAVIPVHMQGMPCNMDRICGIAAKHGIKVLEDACQANGASFGGRLLGSIGDAGALSFNFFKIISCGEGGALLTKDSSIYEKACIYQDSSAIAYFGDQMNGFSQLPFCGNEYRGNEILAAIMCCQLEKLDSIVADLRRNKAKLLSLLGDVCVAPSNDADGDCGIQIPFRFDTYEKAKDFSEKTGQMLLYNCGKHVYYDWAPIMEKRGAAHELMNPYNMPANKDLNHNYSPDMCPKSLDLLKRTVTYGISPDWTDEEIETTAEKIKSILNG